MIKLMLDLSCLILIKITSGLFVLFCKKVSEEFLQILSWKLAYSLCLILGNGALAEHSENVHISGVSTGKSFFVMFKFHA